MSTQGNVPDSIAVTEKEDALGNVVDDNATVDFTVAACNGTIDVGDVQMVHGVATLNPSQRFYTAASALQISASIAGSNTNSAPFDVTANTDILFCGRLGRMPLVVWRELYSLKEWPRTRLFLF